MELPIQQQPQRRVEEAPGQAEERGSRFRRRHPVLLTALVNFSCGANSGWNIGVAAPVLDMRYAESEVEKGLFSSSMILGALAGCMLGSVGAQRYGRIPSLWALSLVGVFFAVLSALGKDLPVLLLSRVMSGVAVGMGSVVAPLYVGEMAPASAKGLLGVLFQISLNSCIFLAALLGWKAQAMWGGWADPGCWLLGLGVLPLVPLLLMLGLNLLVEPPSSSSSSSSSDSCTAATGPASLEAAFPPQPESPTRESSRRMSVASTGSNPTLALVDPAVAFAAGGAPAPPLPQPVNKARLFFAAAMLSVALQLTGINAIVNYGPSMFEKLGIEGMLGQVIFTIYNFLTAVCSLFVVEKIARKTLFMSCLLVMTLSCLGICLVDFLPDVSKNVSQIVVLIGLACFVLTFQLGVGSLFFVLATELFPESLRETGCGFTQVAQFTWNFLMNLLYPIAVAKVGQPAMFGIFGGFGVASLLALLFALPSASPSVDGAAAAAAVAVAPAAGTTTATTVGPAFSAWQDPLEAMEAAAAAAPPRPGMFPAPIPSERP